MEKYINDSLAARIIRPSPSPVGGSEWGLQFMCFGECSVLRMNKDMKMALHCMIFQSPCPGLMPGSSFQRVPVPWS